MSYGIQFNTVAGQRMIDDTYMVPEFIGKLTLTTLDSSAPSAEGPGAYDIQQWSTGVVPYAPDAGQSRMIFWALPSTSTDTWYWPRDAFMYPGTNGNAVGMSIYVGSGVITPPALPEGYVFLIGKPATDSGEQFAVKIWDDSSVLVFDSANLHLNLESVQSGLGFPTTGSTTVTASALPTKAGLLLPMYNRGRRFLDGALDENTLDMWYGVIRRNGLALEGKEIYSSTSTIFYPGGPTTTTNWNGANDSGHTVPVIDATLYD